MYFVRIVCRVSGCQARRCGVEVRVGWLMWCDVGIRRWISTGFKTTKQLEAADSERLDRINAERSLRGAKPLEGPEKKESDEKALDERP